MAASKYKEEWKTYKADYYKERRRMIREEYKDD